MGAPGRRADAAAEPLATPTLLNAEARRRGACTEVTPTSPGPWYAAFEAPAGGIAYDADAAPIGVTVGRFADPPSVAIGGGRPRGTLRLPADGSTQPWRIGFQMAGAVGFCPPAPRLDEPDRGWGSIPTLTIHPIHAPAQVAGTNGVHRIGSVGETSENAESVDDTPIGVVGADVRVLPPGDEP